jgi:hypothetical protein
MKLYTREQMIEAFNYGKTLKGFDWIGDMIDSLKAIELPSDEELEELKNEMKYDEFDAEDIAYFAGMYYMRDKIQGGNK